MHTPESVRASLPDVPVRLPGRKFRRWHVAGRALPFAVVSDPDDPARSIMAAWETLAHVLNTGGALIIR